MCESKSETYEKMLENVYQLPPKIYKTFELKWTNNYLTTVGNVFNDCSSLPPELQKIIAEYQVPFNDNIIAIGILAKNVHENHNSWRQRDIRIDTMITLAESLGITLWSRELKTYQNMFYKDDWFFKGNEWSDGNEWSGPYGGTYSLILTDEIASEVLRYVSEPRQN